MTNETYQKAVELDRQYNLLRQRKSDLMTFYNSRLDSLKSSTGRYCNVEDILNSEERQEVLDLVKIIIDRKLKSVESQFRNL
jgi:hypothetical protein